MNLGNGCMTDHFQVNSSGYKIFAVLHRPGITAFPIVICCHGLLSHKNSTKYRTIASALVAHGIGVIRFDFRGCGNSEGELHESNVSARLDDLMSIIETVEQIDHFNGKFGLVGSSLGGFISILAALRTGKKFPLVTWATPVSLKPLASRIRKSSILPFIPSDKFIEDLEKYSPEEHLHDIEQILVLHGSRDELVDPLDACKIFNGARLPKELHILNDADHRFTDENARQLAVDLTCRWFLKYLF